MEQVGTVTGRNGGGRFLEKKSFAGSLQIRKVNKWYPGNVHAVIDLDMEINPGGIYCFCRSLRVRENDAAAHDSRT